MHDDILLFPEKEAKSVVLLRRRPLGAQPRRSLSKLPRKWTIDLVVFFFFQKKKQKALFRFAEVRSIVEDVGGSKLIVDLLMNALKSQLDDKRIVQGPN
jgi:hypothetical protein